MNENKIRILISDDKEYNRTSLQEILGEEYQLLESGDGLECFNILKQRGNEIALVISDLIMPGLSGIELLRRMQADPEISHIPVIIASSIHQQALVNKAMALGCREYISKPYNPHALRKSILAAISE